MDLKILGLEPWSTKAVSIGQTFGRLTIRAIGKRPGTYRYIAVCDCACGKKEHSVRIDMLKAGSVASCGCGQIDSASTHGQSKHRLFRHWANMMARCTNPNNHRYRYYGARGISVCERWLDPATFFSDMAPTHFDGSELDRKNVNGNYEPDNCRWVTHAEQAANKTTTIYLTLNGRTQRLAEWAKELSFSPATLRNRVFQYRWSDEKALTTPPMDSKTRCELARKSRRIPR